MNQKTYNIITQNANDPAQAGVEALVIRAYDSVKQKDSNPYKDKIVDPSTPDAAIAISSLGTPVYSNLEIEGGSYTDDNGNTIQYPSIRVDSALFIVSQSKNIVKTAVQGRNGTVKEFISDGDYQISISGSISGKGNNIYPKDDVAALDKILKAPVALAVTSWYLNQLGIHSIVVEYYSLPQQPGRNAQQDFQISAVSDTPVILQL
jgi:hypothetical protein